MRQNRIVDFFVTPDERELVLYQRGDTFLIQIDSKDLMTSRAHGSEEEMAALAFVTLGEHSAPRVLVGGLGMGFTLRATLDQLSRVSEAPQVVVAEVFPQVVAWNRGPLADLAQAPLEDPRVRVDERDVALVLSTSSALFDVVLLDVDNGPDALTLQSNRHLYGPRGLRSTIAALAPGGVLAVWSASDDPLFTLHMREAGFDVRPHHVRERSNRGAHHVIFVGKKGDPELSLVKAVSRTDTDSAPFGPRREDSARDVASVELPIDLAREPRESRVARGR